MSEWLPIIGGPRHGQQYRPPDDVEPGQGVYMPTVYDDGAYYVSDDCERAEWQELEEEVE